MTKDSNTNHTKSDDSEIIQLADKLAGMDWQEDDEDEEIRQRLKSLTKGLNPQEVQDAVHHASLIAEQRYLRLEQFLIHVVMKENETLGET